MIRTLTKFLISGLLVAALSGCIMDSADCTGPLAEKSDTRTLQLNVMVPAAEHIASRAEKGENGVTYGTEDGSAAENYLGFDEFDYKVLIFDADGNLLQEFVPETMSTQDADNGILTTLVGPISTTDKDGNRLENIQIMVLANWQHFDDGRYNGFTPGETTLSGLSGNDTDFNFTMPVMSNSTAWSPSITAPKRLIPMFGLSGKIELNYDNAEPVGNGSVILPDVETPTIQMLRAVAKIEVVDKLPDGAGTIQSVTLDNSNAKGRYIPNFNANNNWNVEGTQVTDVSLPGGTIATISHLKFFKETKNINNTEETVWSAYIPEMTLQTGRPTFTVEYGDTKTNTGTFALDYLNEQSESTGKLTQILRNHIYRFTANGLKGVSVNATLEVNPWELEDEEEWDYQNSVTVGNNGYLDWIGWYEAGLTEPDDIKNRGFLDKENFQLVMGAGEVWVRGEFKIDSPINATWYAYFRTVEGAEDAFIFVDANGDQLKDSDGNLLTTASGPVGTTATLLIKNKEAEVTTSNNVATLVVMVQTVDGRWLEADICNGNGNNWTIVQNRTDIYETEGGSN